MAIAIHPIQAVLKVKQGKGSARALRNQDLIPAVIYGGEAKDGKQAEAITLGINAKDLSKALQLGGFYTHKQEIVLEGKTLAVLAREIQRHPVTEKPLHIDFMAYNPARKVRVAVMVKITGEAECPGLKSGGVLQLVETTLEVVCRADSIPAEIEANVAGLNIGEAVHLSSLKLPEGVVAAERIRDLTIVTVISTRTAAMEEEEKKAAEEAAAAAAAAGGAAAAPGAAPAAGAAAPAAAGAKPGDAKAAAPAAKK